MPPQQERGAVLRPVRDKGKLPNDGILFFDEGQQMPQETEDWGAWDNCTACEQFLLSSIVLGKGTFCRVHAATDQLHKRTVAVKLFPSTGENNHAARHRNEVSNLRRLRSTHVVKMLGQGQEYDGRCWIALEQCECTWREHCITRRQSLGLQQRDLLPAAELLQAIKCCTAALEHLESLSVVFLGFQSDKLMRQGSEWKLIDMKALTGVGAVITDMNELNIVPVAVPPEFAGIFMKKGSATISIGVHAWLFSTCVFKLMLGQFINQSHYDACQNDGWTESDQSGKIICDSYLSWLANAPQSELVPQVELKQHMGHELYLMLQQCLHPQPHCRPRMREVGMLKVICELPPVVDSPTKLPTSSRDGAAGTGNQTPNTSNSGVTDVVNTSQTADKKYEVSLQNERPNQGWRCWLFCCVGGAKVEPARQ